MATQIVEIPVSSIEDANLISNDGKGSSTRKFSIDLDGFLNNDFTEFLGQETVPPAQNSAPQSLSSQLIRRQDSNESVSSNSSFYSIDYDDYQQSLLYNDDIESEFMSPLSGVSFPESPSMEDLSKNFNNLAKPNDDEVGSFRRSQKREKVENNEEESSESSSESNSDSDGSVSDPATLKRELELEESQPLLEDEEGVKDEPDQIRDDDDEEYRPVKKRIIGLAKKNDSFSSISSYSSGEASDSEDLDDFEYEDDDDEVGKRGNYEPITKRYKQPLSSRADDLKIGNWSLKDFSADVSDDGLARDVTFDIKILFGRRKIKYEICKPSKSAKSKTTLVIDFPFSQIAGLEFRNNEQTIVFQLSDPPTFSKKEKGKCGKVDDFTSGNASTYQRHHIFVQSLSNFAEYTDRLLSCDRRLRQLAKVGLSPVESTFSKNRGSSGTLPICDWDKENKASKHCGECKSNYCDVCDDVIHRHTTHKDHNRTPVTLIVRPQPAPKPKKTAIKKRKKMNNDRCRCGTGATKGTLGEPCTGNRCPCFSNGKSCVNCGCKNCSNPIRKSKPPGSSKLGAQEAVRV